jgi:hypothetical protein
VPLKTTLALACVAAAVQAAPAAAAHHAPKLSADDVRFYLMGFVDGSLPAPWGAVGSRCKLHHKVFTCEVLARTSGGRARCWHAHITNRGLFLTPLTSTSCKGARPAYLPHL